MASNLSGCCCQDKQDRVCFCLPVAYHRLCIYTIRHLSELNLIEQNVSQSITLLFIFILSFFCQNFLVFKRKSSKFVKILVFKVKVCPNFDFWFIQFQIFQFFCEKVQNLSKFRFLMSQFVRILIFGLFSSKFFSFFFAKKFKICQNFDYWFIRVNFFPVFRRKILVSGLKFSIKRLN